MAPHEVKRSESSLRSVTTESKGYKHLRPLLRNLEQNVPPEIRKEAVEFVTEFSEIFDLGNFL